MKEKITTFADRKEGPNVYSQAEFVILPVPYEKTTTYGHGTSEGPQAILNASPNLEYYDEELGFSPLEKMKIATLAPLESDDPPDIMVQKVKGAVSGLLEDKKIPILLGGEHSVTIGAFSAVKDCYTNLSVVQMDAHADLRDFYEGSPYNHACVMRRVCAEAHTCQLGLRAIDQEEADVMHEKHLDVFFAKDMFKSTGWVQRAIGTLKEDVYLTLDIDVFDASMMPATGTPEPGGLGWYDVVFFLRQLIFQKNIVGVDIVEFAPLMHFHAYDFTVAKLLYKIMGYMTHKKLFL